MKRILTILLLTSLSMFVFGQADVTRSNKVPLTGANQNKQSIRDYNLTAVGNLRVPVWNDWSLRNGKDSSGYIMFNSTLGQFGGYNGTTWIPFGADLTNYYTKAQSDGKYIFSNPSVPQFVDMNVSGTSVLGGASGGVILRGIGSGIHISDNNPEFYIDDALGEPTNAYKFLVHEQGTSGKIRALTSPPFAPVSPSGSYIQASPVNPQAANIDITGTLKTPRIYTNLFEDLDGGGFVFTPAANADFHFNMGSIGQRVLFGAGLDPNLTVEFFSTIKITAEPETATSDYSAIVRDNTSGELQQIPNGFILASPSSPQAKNIDISGTAKIGDTFRVFDIRSNDDVNTGIVINPTGGLYVNMGSSQIFNIGDSSGELVTNITSVVNLVNPPTLATGVNYTLVRDSVSGEIKQQKIAGGGGGSSYTFNNGLTNTVGTVGLGGDAVWSFPNSVQIGDDGYGHTYNDLNASVMGVNYLGGNEANVLIQKLGGGSLNIDMRSSQTGLGSRAIVIDNVSTTHGINIIDDLTGHGAFYGGDYSVGRTFPTDSLWIPNAGWVLSQIASGSSPISNVFGRTGAVVATSGDYNTSQVTENTNLYYTATRFNTAFSGKSTTDLTEGTNLYFTQGRVSANTDVTANTASRHSAVTIGTANGLSLVGQALSMALANGTVTGALSATDYNTFNNKQSVISLTTTGTSGAATFIGNTLNIPQYAGTTYSAGNGITFTGTVISADTAIVATNANTLSLAETFTRFGSGNFFPQPAVFTGGGTSTSDYFNIIGATGVTGTGAVMMGTAPTASALTVTGNITNSTLTASQDVATDASKNLVSIAITGTGLGVRQTSPSLITPALGVATATSLNGLTVTSSTGTLTVVNGSSLITSGAFASTLTSTATSNNTLPAGTNTLYGTGTGSITSAQLLGSLSNETGTGVAVFATTPTLVTPVLGVATATSINKVTITAPTTSSTLTLVQGSTLQTTGAFALNLTTTANSTPTFPTGTGALGYQLTGSASLNFPSTTSMSTSSLTLTVTGAAVGDVVSLGLDVATLAITGNYVFTGYVSATDTVTIKFDNNNAVTTLDPTTATFKVKVFK